MNITNENNNTNKNRRRLLNKKININQIKPNKTDINKQINRKIRKLEGYDHTMGSITRNDIKSDLLYTTRYGTFLELNASINF